MVTTPALAVYVGVAAAVAVVAALLRRNHAGLANALAFAVNAFIIGTFPRLDSDPDRVQAVNYLSPAPYGFAIWGAIYVTEFVFVIWQWLNREEPFVKKWIPAFSPWWCAGNLFQVAWGLSFQPAFDTKALAWIPAVALTCVAASLSQAHGSIADKSGGEHEHHSRINLMDQARQMLEHHARVELDAARDRIEEEVPQYTPGPLKVFLPCFGAMGTLQLFMPCFPKQAADKLRSGIEQLDKLETTLNYPSTVSFIVRVPVALHFGWTTAASLVGWNLYVATLGASTSLKLLAACLSVVLATVVGALVTVRRKSALYGATLAWALVAVAQETRTSESLQADLAGSTTTWLAALEYVSACGLLAIALMVKLKA